MSEKKAKYPSKKYATCIVCEDVRIERFGKLILLGVYPGGAINFLKEISEENPGHIQLAFCFWFIEGEGQFETKFSVFDPNGKLLIARDIEQQTAVRNKSLSFIVAHRNAEFQNYGRHRILLTLDDHEYEFPLDISHQPQVVS